MVWEVCGMDSRLELHNELLQMVPNVYFQPPSNIQMKYPCIVYAKSDNEDLYANNRLYATKQQYDLTLIEDDPTTEVATNIRKHFSYCSISNYYVVDNLHHTKLNLYY